MCQTERAKDLLEYVKANYTKIDKTKVTTYLKFLTTTMYDEVGGVRNHIIKLKHYLNKWDESGVEWEIPKMVDTWVFSYFLWCGEVDL